MRNSRWACAAATLVIVGGCSAASTDAGGAGADAQDVVAMKTPEALARVLAADHAVGALGSFLDTRPGAIVPVVMLTDVPPPDGRLVSFAPARLAAPAIRSILEVGREADRLGLPVRADAVEFETIETRSGRWACYPAGVHARVRDHPIQPFGFPDTMRTLVNNVLAPEAADYTESEKATVERIRSEVRFDVLIALPGPEEHARAVVLAFGVVRRSPDPAAGTAPEPSWTLLSAIDTTRCFSNNGD